MTQLKDIDYVLKAFNDSLVENKIVVRDARKDLASPVRFHLKFLVGRVGILI